MLSRIWFLLAPVVVLAAAQLLGPQVELLPPTLAGLRSWGPLFLILLAGALAFAFNRGRVLFAVATVAAAFAGYKLLATGGIEGFTSRTVFLAICVFVPLNLLALMVLRERGIWNMYGLRRGGSIALQILLTAWVAREHLTPITEALYSPLINHPALVGSSIPQVGMLLMLASVALGLVACVVRRSATEAGLAAAVAAMAIACDNIGSANVFQVFTGAAALILTIAVLQDAYRLAFHDELTGLPGRRALNERLLALGRHYTIAMVDVDHFKDVNDEHGHDFGDQVLRMVAARLARARGGGRAYRYGGEEFVVVFAGRSLGEAVPRLEALRKEIEGYRMTFRAPDRPRVREAQRSKARNPQPAPTIVVTVSIGVAERNERNPTPSAVLQAADKALYRAKGKGRNQTCW